MTSPITPLLQYPQSRLLSVSHNDLDGISCQILLNNYFKNCTLTSCSYSDTLDTLKMVKKKLHEYDTLVVTDLVLTSDILAYINEFLITFKSLKIYWFDHHYQSLEVIPVNNPNSSLHIIVNTDISATKLISRELSITSEYINAVNAFDMWDTDSSSFKLGMVYNTLFWSYKHRSYFSQFKTDQTLLDVHKNEYKKIVKNKDEYFQNLNSRGLILKNDKTIVIFGDNFQNWTQLSFPGYDFNVQVFSFGKILIKIGKMYTEDQCIIITNKIMSSINNDLLLNAGGHYHILSLTHTGDKDYNIIIDYTKKIYGILSSI